MMFSRWLEWKERLSVRDPDDVVCELDITTQELLERFNDKVTSYLDKEVGSDNDQVYNQEELT